MNECSLFLTAHSDSVDLGTEGVQFSSNSLVSTKHLHTDILGGQVSMEVEFGHEVYRSEG